MISTRKKKQHNRKLPNHLDDFGRDVFFGHLVSKGRQNVRLNRAAVDRHSTVINKNYKIALTKENAVVVQTFESSISESVAKEVSNVVQTVQDRFQNAVLAASDCIITS